MTRAPRTVLVLLLFATIGCGGGGSGGGDTSSAIDLTGTWATTFTSHCGQCGQQQCNQGVEYAALTLTQHGTNITGMFQHGSGDSGMCWFNNVMTDAYLTGTVSGDSLLMRYAIGTIGMDFNLSVTGAQLSGSYTPTGVWQFVCKIPCAGTLVANRQ